MILEARNTKLASLKGTECVLFAVASAVLLGMAAFLGVAGPEPYVIESPDAGADVDLSSSQGWSHAYQFTANEYSNHFGLQFIPTASSLLTDRKFTTDMHLHVEVGGITYANDQKRQEENGDWPDYIDPIADEVIVRQVNCFKESEDATATCDPVLVFFDQFVDYKLYWWKVVWVNDDGSAPVDVHAWMESAQFQFKKENLKWAIFEIRANYAAVGIAALALLYWGVVNRSAHKFHISQQMADEEENPASLRSGGGLCRSCCGCCGCQSYFTASSRWVLTLLVTVMLFCQPLYGFVYLYAEGARGFFSVLSLILQMVFIAAVLIFWLAAFESVYSQSSGRFALLPKLAFALVVFLAGAIVYGRYLTVVNTSMFYDYTYADEYTRAASIVFLVIGIVYLVWVSFVSLRALGHMRALGAGEQTVIVSHMVHMLLFVITLAMGAAFQVDPRFTNAHIFVQYLMLFYVLELTWVYTPVHTSNGKDASDGLGAQSVEMGRSGAAVNVGPGASTTTDVNLSLV